MPVQPPSLRILTVAEPCTVPWSEMRGDARTRFCGQCRKNVYNIESLTDAETDELLSRAEVPCVRFRRRQDGTLVTRDCSRMKLWADRVRYAAAACLAVIVGVTTSGCATTGSLIDPSELRRDRKAEATVPMMGTPAPAMTTQPAGNTP